MDKKEYLKKMQELERLMTLENRERDLNRARSFTVGSSGGGTTEIAMTMNSGKTVWSILQPVEVVELIHQLAANVGCHIALKPRDDFSSWREWRISEAEKKHLGGHPPFVNDLEVFKSVGAIGFDQQLAESTMAEWLKQKEYEYVNGGATYKKEAKQNSEQTTEELKEETNEALAAEKSSNKPVSKRTTDPS
jgi:hypothetical protein